MQRKHAIPALQRAATRLFNDLATYHPYTAEHSLGVTHVVGELLQMMPHPWSETEITQLLLGAKLHDLGKLGIPLTILDKPGRLTPEEFAVIKTHPQQGLQLLDQAILSAPHIVRDAIFYHHEAFHASGDGYPSGLTGEDIPLAARYVAIADTFDALIGERSYKRGLPVNKAAEIMQEMSGTKLDPRLTRTFLQHVEAIAA